MTDVFKLSSAIKSTVTAHIKIGDEWKLISQTSVASTRSQDLQINVSSLGLKHGAYTVRIVAQDVESGVWSNYQFFDVMIVNPSSLMPIVRLRIPKKRKRHVSQEVCKPEHRSGVL